MNSCKYDQFQLEDQIKRNQNLCTVKIEGTKRKSKIKRLRTEMKLIVYNQFQLKGIIEEKQKFHSKINNKNEIQSTGTEIKYIQIGGTALHFTGGGERKERAEEKSSPEITHPYLIYTHRVWRKITWRRTIRDEGRSFSEDEVHCTCHLKDPCDRNTVGACG